MVILRLTLVVGHVQGLLNLYRICAILLGVYVCAMFLFMMGPSCFNGALSIKLRNQAPDSEMGGPVFCQNSSIWASVGFRRFGGGELEREWHS